MGEFWALIRRLGLAEVFRPELERLRGRALLAPPPGTIAENDDDFLYEFEAHTLENIA